MVNCEQVWQEISNYIDGELAPGVRAEIDEHIRGCKQCASVYAGMKNVVALYGDERMLEVPSGFGRRLEKRLAQSVKAERRGWSTWSAWLVPVAALLLITGGVGLARSLTREAPIKSELAQLGKGIPPDLQVVVGADTKVFHLAGCGVIHNKEKLRTLTAKQALQEGYVPCVDCLRKYVKVVRLRTSTKRHDEIATLHDPDEIEELRIPGR